jgi:cephalosporin-C deacetylase-like acetyl esterase
VTNDPFQFYPDPAAVDAWLDEIWQAGQQADLEAELLDETGFTPQLGFRHVRGCSYVRLSGHGGAPFYGYWQPAPSQPAPLLVHTPGYGAEMSAHPDLVALGYNVLHVNPLGYVGPEGADAGKQRDGSWPVFPETLESGAQRGYRQWFTDCVCAIRWATGRPEVLPDRISFLGTSQGGGASLLLGSLYHGRGVRCVAADEPWLVDFPLAAELKPDWAQNIAARSAGTADPAPLWRTLGLLDALSHVHRLTVPVLLTAGGSDVTCPPPTIEALFTSLPSTKLYCLLDGQAHGYTREFVTLAGAWFRLYA